jgi:hypothetical protein
VRDTARAAYFAWRVAQAFTNVFINKVASPSQAHANPNAFLAPKGVSIHWP